LKNFYTIFLLIVLLAPLIGTVLYLHNQRIKARKEARELIISGLDQNNLVLIKFTDEESLSLLVWEHPGEFEYQGQMYDIVSTGTCGDTTYYRCFADHKESRINKAIEQTVAKAVGQDPARKNQTDRLTDFFKSLFHQEMQTLQTANINVLNLQFSTFNLQYSSPSFSPPSPPPKES
jgi:hypothetical protein